MAKKTVILPDVEVNPTFFIPAGTQGMTYDTDATELDYRLVDQRNDANEQALLNGPEEVVQDISVEGDDVEGLAVPVIESILSQEVKVADAGQMVVDVILGVSDVPMATNYEVRVTKV